jgi:hypothetical protein
MPHSCLQLKSNLTPLIALSLIQISLSLPNDTQKSFNHLIFQSKHSSIFLHPQISKWLFNLTDPQDWMLCKPILANFNLIQILLNLLQLAKPCSVEISFLLISLIFISFLWQYILFQILSHIMTILLMQSPVSASISIVLSNWSSQPDAYNAPDAPDSHADVHKNRFSTFVDLSHILPKEQQLMTIKAWHGPSFMCDESKVDRCYSILHIGLLNLPSIFDPRSSMQAPVRKTN